VFKFYELLLTDFGFRNVENLLEQTK